MTTLHTVLTLRALRDGCRLREDERDALGEAIEALEVIASLESAPARRGPSEPLPWADEEPETKRRRAHPWSTFGALRRQG